MPNTTPVEEPKEENKPKDDATATEDSSNTVGSTDWLSMRQGPFTNSKGTRWNNTVEYAVPGSGRVYRGYMREFFHPGQGNKPKPKETYQLSFLYNPNTVSVGYDLSAGSNQYMPWMQTSEGLEGTSSPGMAGITMSFDLLLERLGIPGAPVPKNVTAYKPDGVMHDIRIFDKILSRGMGGDNKLVYSYMSVVRVRFSRHGGGIHPPLGFIGVITGASLNYTRFNIDMVPVRASIGVTLRAYMTNPEITEDGTSGPGGNVGYTMKYAGRLGQRLLRVTAGASRGVTASEPFYNPRMGSNTAVLPSFTSPESDNSAATGGAGSTDVGSTRGTGTSTANGGSAVIAGHGYVT